MFSVAWFESRQLYSTFFSLSFFFEYCMQIVDCPKVVLTSTEQIKSDRIERILSVKWIGSHSFITSGHLRPPLFFFLWWSQEIQWSRNCVAIPHVHPLYYDIRHGMRQNTWMKNRCDAAIKEMPKSQSTKTSIEHRFSLKGWITRREWNRKEIYKQNYRKMSHRRKVLAWIQNGKHEQKKVTPSTTNGVKIFPTYKNNNKVCTYYNIYKSFFTGYTCTYMCLFSLSPLLYRDRMDVGKCEIFRMEIRFVRIFVFYLSLV